MDDLNIRVLNENEQLNPKLQVNSISDGMDELVSGIWSTNKAEKK